MNEAESVLIRLINRKNDEIAALRVALTEARGWIVLAEDMGRDTSKALALVDAALQQKEGE